jgi:nucleoside-diphosphate-sugar epimerase
MRVLVTGGSGFIGGYVVETLRMYGIFPVVFDRKSRLWPEGVEVHLGDTRDFTAVMESVGSTDGFIHLAGVLGTQETVDEPEPAVQTNIIGGLNVFTAARHYKKRGVYIAVGNHWMNNSYSITKTTAERFALMANAEWGTEIAVVRALNAYGPKQKAEPVRKIMPNFVVPALRNKPITVYGNGKQVMDMIYVADVAEILVRALTEDHGRYDSIFEAGTGRPTTVNDVLSVVLREVERRRGYPPRSLDSLVEHTQMRPGETKSSVVLGNPETLKPLGMSATDLMSLEDGVSRTVDWYEMP